MLERQSEWPGSVNRKKQAKLHHLFARQQYYANVFSYSKHYDNRNKKQQVIEKIWKFKEILDLVI